MEADRHGCVQPRDAAPGGRASSSAAIPMPRRVMTGEGAERAAVRGLSGWVEVRREDVRPVGRVRKEKEEDDLWDPHMSGWGGGKLKELLRFGEWE